MQFPESIRVKPVVASTLWILDHDPTGTESQFNMYRLSIDVRQGYGQKNAGQKMGGIFMPNIFLPQKSLLLTRCHDSAHVRIPEFSLAAGR